MSAGATLTHRIGSVLQCLSTTAGTVTIDARDMSGFRHVQQEVTVPCTQAPLAVLRLLIDRCSLRVTPFTTVHLGGAELPVLFAVWRPETSTNGRETTVLPEAVKPIRAALGSMPRPTVLVDAGGEVWAGWRLEVPLLADVAIPALAALAGRLNAEPPPSDYREFHLPMAGVIRNWNTVTIDDIQILEAEPTRRYQLTDLMKETAQ